MTEEDFTGDVHPPYRRKNGFKELSERLDKHVAYLEGRLRRFFTKALVAFAVLGMTSAGALLGFGIVLKEQNETDRVIQDQRYQNIRENCIDQNIRHDNATARAKKLLPSQTREVVVQILDELQPFVRNCNEYARERVKGEF